MTLILASVRPHDLVLTSDGRSTTLRDGRVERINDRYQKLFPVPQHPLVLAHMGENDIGHTPIREFLDKFVRSLNVGNYTIQEIADKLREYAHAPIRARFRETKNPAWGVNLWIAGVGYHEEGPSMIELFWKMTDGVLRTEERRFLPTAVVPGGDGQDQIGHVDWRRIDRKSVDEVSRYHDSLMREAIAAKVEPNSVGGMVHEVVITAEHWRWTRPPENPPATAPSSQPG